jgi:hypothetical protein
MSPPPRLTRRFVVAQRRRRWLRKYWQATRRPVYGLAVALPLLIVYEVGTRWLTPTGMAAPLWAQGLIRELLGWIGISGSWLPPLLVLAVLLAWFLSQGTGWRIRPLALTVIPLEGLILAVPLLVISRLLLSTSAGLLDGVGRGQALLDAVGASVYEEFVFRLLLLGLAQTALHAHSGWSRTFARNLCLAVSTVCFAAAHFTPLSDEPWSWGAALFYGLAGLYLGLLYEHRGLALAISAHAMHNLLVTLLR